MLYVQNTWSLNIFLLLIGLINIFLVQIKFLEDYKIIKFWVKRKKYKNLYKIILTILNRIFVDF